MSALRLPAYRDDRVTVFLGDARQVLAELPSASVDCCVTSPPYWGRRDYRLPPLTWGGELGCQHRWGNMGKRGDLLPADVTRSTGRIGTSVPPDRAGLSGGRFCRHCGAWQGSLGQEPMPELYAEHLVEVLGHVRRVLKPTGTLWLNLGHSYAGPAAWQAADTRGGGPARSPRPHAPAGLKAKDMVGIPWRVAMALRCDGWYLRSDVIWAKPNPMPESVRDRPTRAHEYVFLLSKSPWYYYDTEAVREPASSRYQHLARRELYTAHGNGQTSRGSGSGHQVLGNLAIGRNLRMVFTIATQPYRGLHVATFPTRLVDPCIHAGSSAHGCCQRCGAPWERAGPKFLGWRPSCDCQVSDPVPSVVLDPFAGSGTTLAVAAGLGRQAIGVELNPDYVQLIRRRCAAVTTLLKSRGAA